jgi:hypothetical protein
VPTSRELELQIEKIERFKVRIVSDSGRRVRSDATDFVDYPKKIAANGDLTVAAWIKARFKKYYDGYEVIVYDEDGDKVGGGKHLETIRFSAPRTKMDKDPALNMVQPIRIAESSSQLPIPGMQPSDQITPDEQINTSILNCILEILKRREQPSALELVNYITQEYSLEAKWIILDVVSAVVEEGKLPWSAKSYLESIFQSGELANALEGDFAEDESVKSTIDSLIHKSRAYRNSRAFKEMIEFMARFKNYSPFNNMLVKVQNPSCGFFATEKVWDKKHGRWLKEDARPMLILAPMHPVMLVFDQDQTDGRPLPAELEKFAKYTGNIDYECLDRAIQNAHAHYRIRIDFKCLSSINAGFATTVRGDSNSLMRIAIHEPLSIQSKVGVLCHELAHILLGHLGTSDHNWWPSRQNLGKSTVEIEAEAVAYIVSARLGLEGACEEYISRYLKDGAIPNSISLDTIAKVAGRVEDIFKNKLKFREIPEKKKP